MKIRVALLVIPTESFKEFAFSVPPTLFCATLKVLFCEKGTLPSGDTSFKF